MTSTPPASAPRRRRVLLRVAAACVVLVALLGIGTTPASAQEPVPCADIGGGKYNCEWWRAGDGIGDGSMVVRDGRVVGHLHQGTNWVVCQQQGAKVHNASGNQNTWYAWTESDGAGEWGWVSALDARGGTDFGQFGGGVPNCSAYRGSPAPSGGPPSVEGLWETTPPSGGGSTPPAPVAPVAPAPPPPPATPPRSAAPSDHNVYRAGQWLTFDSLAGKQQCTAAFVLIWNDQPFGVSAGHCSGADRWGKPAYGSVFHEIGGGLERVGSVGAYTRGDGLLFGELTRYDQVIERGRQRPIRVTGFVSPDQLTARKEVCFAGRASGADTCAKMVGTPMGDRGCMATEARPADSGGPVYLKTGPNTALAAGVLSGNSRTADGRTVACFTPITAIMSSFPCVDCVTLPLPTSGTATGRPLIEQVDARSTQRRRKGLRITTRLTKRAVVTLRVRRAGGSAVHTVRRKVRAGRSVVRIRRLGRRALRRGTYHVTASAQAGTARSTSWRLSVRLR